MRAPRWLRSRFVVVPLAIAVAIAAWNVYVARHDNGHLAGRVEDASGAPIGGATVVLFERAFANEVPRARTRTDRQGRFRFEGNRAYVIALQARSPDGSMSPRMSVHLWFRAQDRVVRKPLIVGPRIAG